MFTDHRVYAFHVPYPLKTLGMIIKVRCYFIYSGHLIIVSPALFA